MTTTPSPSAGDELTELAELAEIGVGFDVELVRDAIAAHAAATTPVPVGDTGLGHVVPDGWRLHVEDLTRWETHPRTVNYAAAFTQVDSLARYVARYGTGNTLGYATSIPSDPAAVIKLLVEPRVLLTYVIDDHPADIHTNTATHPARREHYARLHTVPTVAARRWGAALNTRLNQEQMLDLVADGITEIAEPDGATLRDIVSDLHAIRRSSVQSVIRTGGNAEVTLAENVDLHGGTGNRVVIPETITIVLHPFTLSSRPIAATVRVKPSVDANGRVVFELTSPELAAALHDVCAEIVLDATDQLAGFPPPLWII